MFELILLSYCIELLMSCICAMCLILCLHVWAIESLYPTSNELVVKASSMENEYDSLKRSWSLLIVTSEGFFIFI